MCQMLATLCVALSLALVALGGSDPTSRFHFKTLRVAGPLTIMGHVFNTVDVSCDVKDASCNELGWHINSCLLQILQPL
jgi:hypothetical protein